VKRTLKKRSKGLEVDKRERYGVSDCAQLFTLSAKDNVGCTVVYATERLIVQEGGGIWLCRVSTSVRDSGKRSEEGRSLSHGSGCYRL
jgi:hypothetical protein